MHALASTSARPEDEVISLRDVSIRCGLGGCLEIINVT
jgi:hypothetical protein